MSLGLSLGLTRGAAGPLNPALAILARYGADAHLWLPGVGTVSGLTAANFLDSNGTSPAAVDGPVGYVGDRYGTLNATQATTASKPILRQSGGLYSWQFDGVNDHLVLSDAPFQIADAHTVIVSVRIATQSIQALFHVGMPGVPSYLELSISSAGTPRVALRDQFSTFAHRVGSSALSTGRNYVAAYKHAAGNVVLRIDGAVAASGPLATNQTTPITSGAIGVRRADNALYIDGNIGPVIAIKGAVSDADLLTLERWVGSLSGVTIP